MGFLLYLEHCSGVWRDGLALIEPVRTIIFNHGMQGRGVHVHPHLRQTCTVKSVTARKMWAGLLMCPGIACCTLQGAVTQHWL
jgi:hypothetical protein